MRRQMRERRLKLGLTQEQVAERAGITRSAYAKYESGRRGMNLIKAHKVAKALKVDFDGSFFVKEGDKTSQTEGRKNDQSKTG